MRGQQNDSEGSTCRGQGAQLPLEPRSTATASPRTSNNLTLASRYFTSYYNMDETSETM